MHFFVMKDLNPIISCVLGALIYIVNSELLPDWSHLRVGLFTAAIFIVVYWLLTSRLAVTARVVISLVAAIAAAAIVRFFCY